MARPSDTGLRHIAEANRTRVWSEDSRRKLSSSLRKYGERWTKDGYIIIRCEDGIARPEHRVVMERVLGRPLLRHEIIHHINSDRSDNRPENLQVMTRGEHAAVHKTGIPRPLEVREKIRAAQRDIPRGAQTPEHRAKIAEALKQYQAKKRAERRSTTAHGG